MKEQILNCLNDPKNGEANRKLLAFCKEPTTFAEMEKRAGVKGDLLKVLVALKNAEGIAWVDGKYYSTPLGLEVLASLQ